MRVEHVNQGRGIWNDLLKRGSFVPSTAMSLIGCRFCLEDEGLEEKDIFFCKCDVRLDSCSTKQMRKHYMEGHNGKKPSWWWDYFKKGQARNDDTKKTTNKTQPKLLSEFVCTSARQEQLEKALAKYIGVQGGMPANIVQDNAWSSFLQICQPGFKVPDRNTHQRRMDTEAEKATKAEWEKLQEHVKQGVRYSVTIDGWSSISRFTHEGIIAWFRDPAMKLVKAVLGLVPSLEGGRAPNIRDVIVKRITEVVGEKGLALCMGIVTDGAKVMLALRSLHLISLWESLVCPCHKFQRIIYDYVVHLENSKPNWPTPLHFSLFSCLQHLAGLMHGAQGSKNFLQDYRTFCDSTKAKDKMITKRCNTRWGASLKQCRGYDDVKETLVALKADTNVKKTFTGSWRTLDEEEEALRLETVALLEPVEQATRLFEGSDYCSPTSLLYYTHWVKWNLEPDSADSDSCAELRQMMRDKAAVIFEEASWNKPLQCKLSLLDPRYKNLKIMTEEERQEAKQELLVMMQQLGPKKHATKAETNPQPAMKKLKRTLSTLARTKASENKQETTETAIASEEAALASSSRAGSTITISKEILSEWVAYDQKSLDMEPAKWPEFDLGSWWKGHEALFPRLFLVARHLLSLVSSSGLNSRAAYIGVKARNRLLPERFEKLVTVVHSVVRKEVRAAEVEIKESVAADSAARTLDTTGGFISDSGDGEAEADQEELTEEEGPSADEPDDDEDM